MSDWESQLLLPHEAAFTWNAAMGMSYPQILVVRCVVVRNDHIWHGRGQFWIQFYSLHSCSYTHELVSLGKMLLHVFCIMYFKLQVRATVSCLWLQWTKWTLSYEHSLFLPHMQERSLYYYGSTGVLWATAQRKTSQDSGYYYSCTQGLHLSVRNSSVSYYSPKKWTFSLKAKYVRS